MRALSKRTRTMVLLGLALAALVLYVVPFADIAALATKGGNGGGSGGNAHGGGGNSGNGNGKKCGIEKYEATSCPKYERTAGS